MVRGGLIGLGVATAAVVVAAFVVRDAQSAVTALVAALIVGSFFLVGQLVEAFALRLTDFRGFGLVLVSYTVRIGLLGAVLLIALSNQAWMANLPLGWFAIGALGGVIGWLGGFLFAHSRQRIAIYDEPVGDVRGDAQ